MIIPVLKKHWFLPAVIASILGLLGALHHFPDANMMTFDIYGYYSYLPAAISYGDLESFSFVNGHFENYKMGSGPFQIMQVENGAIPIYTMGLALLLLPFYLLAEISALLIGSPTDGLSSPYQWWFLIASMTYSFIGFFYLNKWLDHKVSQFAKNATLVSIAFGTNYLIYAAVDNGLTHAFIFSLYALLLFKSEEWIISGKISAGYICAAVLAILCLIRPTEMIALVLPLGIMLKSKSLPKIFASQWKHLVGMLLLAIVIILPQIILWKANTGQWVFNAYAAQGHSFVFDGSNIWNGLLSYRKGWLVYTPLMVLAVFGFVELWRKKSDWFWPILIYIGLHIYAVFSWNMWWYASSFGSRPMVHAYAALSLPLALLFAAKFSWKWIIFSLALIFVALNVFQSWQYKSGILPGDGINKVFYWKAFGQTEKDSSRIKYVDLKDHLPNLQHYQPIALTKKVWEPNNQKDHTVFIADKFADQIPPDRTFGDGLVYYLPDSLDRTEKTWLNVFAESYRSGDQFNAWHIAELAISFYNSNGEQILSDGIRFPFYIREKEWAEANFEIPIPEEMKAGDMMKVFVWNHSPDTIFIHSMGIDLLSKK